MKKKVLLLATALLSTVALASCGGDEGGRTNTGKVKTLTYLLSKESTAYQTILDELLKEFNAQIKEEGYRIETEVPGGEYYQSLGNKFAAGSAPDIMMMEIGYFNAYSRFLEPLDSYIDASSVLSTTDLWELNDEYRDSEGNLKALIKDFSPDFMMIYNKTALDSYNAANPNNQYIISDTEPMTWVEFYEMSSAIQNHLGKDKNYGTSIGFEPVKHLHEIVQSTGSTMYINGDTELNYQDENVRAAFQFYCALQKDNAEEFPTYNNVNKCDGKAPASYTSGSNTSEQELFKAGRCFAIFNGLYSFPAYDFYNCNFEVGVAPHPVMKAGDKAYATTSAMVSHCVSNKSKYKDIAWRWLEFYQTEGLKRFASIAFNIPGNKTIAGSDAFLKNEDPKVAAMAKYFYDFAASGSVYATKYNPNVSFSRIQTCFSTHLAKYYDGNLSFDKLLEEINKSVKASM